MLLFKQPYNIAKRLPGPSLRIAEFVSGDSSLARYRYLPAAALHPGQSDADAEISWI